jgi:hypothetical protein
MTKWEKCRGFSHIYDILGRTESSLCRGDSTAYKVQVSSMISKSACCSHKSECSKQNSSSSKSITVAPGLGLPNVDEAGQVGAAGSAH